MGGGAPGRRARPPAARPRSTCWPATRSRRGGRARDGAAPAARPRPRRTTSRPRPFEPNPVKDLADRRAAAGPGARPAGRSDERALEPLRGGGAALAPLGEAAVGRAVARERRLPGRPGGLRAQPGRGRARRPRRPTDARGRGATGWRSRRAPRTSRSRSGRPTTSSSSRAAPGGALSGRPGEQPRAAAQPRRARTTRRSRRRRAAVFEDPASSVFTDTLAYAYQRAGQDDEAIAAYRRVLRADPTAYVSANNLGVLLAEAGEWEEAETLVRAGGGHRAQTMPRPGTTSAACSARAGRRHGYVASQAALAEAVAPGLVVPRRRAGLWRWTSRCVTSTWTSPGPWTRTGSSRTRSRTRVRRSPRSCWSWSLLRVAWSLGLGHHHRPRRRGRARRGGRSRSWP